MDLDEAETRAKPTAEPKPEIKTGIKLVPENMERVFDPDEDEYFLILKTITKKTQKILLNLNLNLNLNLKIMSTRE